MSHVRYSAVAKASSSSVAARLSLVAAAATLAFLAALHVLSPEFDPSWRMVSEFANGQHSLVLSLMFASWAVSSWALAYAIWPVVSGRAGKIGLVFLLLAGIGETMAAAFDIKHPLHSLAAAIGIPSLPIAAMLITLNLVRVAAWRPARTALLATANLTWISFVLMAAAFAVFVSTFQRAGGDMSGAAALTTLPDGTVALIGWANRLLIVAYCGWVMTVAWLWGTFIRSDRQFFST